MAPPPSRWSLGLSVLTAVWSAVLVAAWFIVLYGVATRWWPAVAACILALAVLAFVGAPSFSPSDSVGVVLVVPMLLGPAMCFWAILS